MNFAFDMTVKLGDILTALTFLGFGISAFYNIKGKLDIGELIMTTLKTEVNDIKETLKLNASTLTLVATQKVEIEHIKQDLHELKHGEGFVLPLKSRT